MTFGNEHHVHGQRHRGIRRLAYGTWLLAAAPVASDAPWFLEVERATKGVPRRSMKRRAEPRQWSFGPGGGEFVTSAIEVGARDLDSQLALELPNGGGRRMPRRRDSFSPDTIESTSIYETGQHLFALIPCRTKAGC